MKAISLIPLKVAPVDPNKNKEDNYQIRTPKSLVSNGTAKAWTTPELVTHQIQLKWHQVKESKVEASVAARLLWSRSSPLTQASPPNITSNLAIFLNKI